MTLRSIRRSAPGRRTGAAAIRVRATYSLIGFPQPTRADSRALSQDEPPAVRAVREREPDRDEGDEEREMPERAPGLEVAEGQGAAQGNAVVQRSHVRERLERRR